MNECKHCGAPLHQDAFLCEFCGHQTDTEAGRSAITCTGCKTLNAGTSKQCKRCNGALLTVCLFCGAHSPLGVSHCTQCREPFAGAQDRIRKRDEERKHQQTMQTVSTIGAVAVGALGALFGASKSNSSSSSDSYAGSSGEGNSTGSSGWSEQSGPSFSDMIEEPQLPDHPSSSDDKFDGEDK